MIGTTEAVIVGAIIMLLFGARKIPELARGLGQARKAFDEGLQEPVAEKSSAATSSDDEREKVLDVARALGIKVEGRSLEEIKADMAQQVKEN